MCLYSYHAYFILSGKSEKCVTKRKERLNLWSLLIGELSSWFQLTESWKMICARPYAWFLKILSSRGGLDCFLLPNVLPKLSKITVTCLKALKWMSRVNFDLPKVGRMTINFEQLKVSKITDLKIYISQVMEKVETSNLGIR